MERRESERLVSETIILEGMISVVAALEARSRIVQAVYIREDKRDADALKLTRLAAREGIPVERVSQAAIAAYAHGESHGGIVAAVGERQYMALDALVADVENPLIVMLDGVEDPFNYGQAIRACYAAGVDGLVTRPRSWQQAAGVVTRASAGASERMPTAVAESAEEASRFFRAYGLRIAVTDMQRAMSIYDADLSGRLFLVIGGEKRGITRAFADKADMRLKIPYGRAFEHALGTTAATATLVFEIMRQRRGA